MSEALSRHPHPGHGRHWWRGDSTGLKLARHTLALVALAVLLVPFADLAIHTREPWAELGRMALGMAWPAWGSLESPLTAIGLTVAVAIWGTLAGVVLGFPLALLFARSRRVRLRARHPRAVLGAALPAGLRAVGADRPGGPGDPLRGDLRQGLCGDPRAGAPRCPAPRQRAAVALRLHRAAAGLGAAGRLYPLPLRVRPARQRAAGLRRPADAGLPPGDGLPRGALPRGRRPALALLPADRQPALVGASAAGPGTAGGRGLAARPLAQRGWRPAVALRLRGHLAAGAARRGLGGARRLAVADSRAGAGHRQYPAAGAARHGGGAGGGAAALAAGQSPLRQPRQPAGRPGSAGRAALDA